MFRRTHLIEVPLNATTGVLRKHTASVSFFLVFWSLLVLAKMLMLLMAFIFLLFMHTGTTEEADAAGDINVSAVCPNVVFVFLLRL